MIRVLFFGPVAERIGTNTIQVEYRNGLLLQNLRDELAARHAKAFEIVSLVALNGEHVRDMALPLDDNSEVVFMSNFSGG